MTSFGSSQGSCASTKIETMTREVKQTATQSRRDALTPKLLCADLGFSGAD